MQFYLFLIAVVCAWLLLWHFSWHAVRSGSQLLWQGLTNLHRLLFLGVSATELSSPISAHVPVINSVVTHPPSPLVTASPAEKPSQVETTVSTPSGSYTSDTSREGPSKKQVFCQSHLVRWDGRNGQLMDTKPCKGRRVRSTGLLALDTLTQNGIVLANGDQNLEDVMCSRHRQIYAGRVAEIKCRNANCFGIGILLEHRWKRYLECQQHLQKRLDGKETPGPDNVLDKRREHKQISVSAARSPLGADSGTSRGRPAHKGVEFKDGDDIGQSGRGGEYSSSSGEEMPQLRQPFEEEEPGNRARRPSSTSLGSASTKTMVSGVSYLGVDMHNDMSDRVAGLMRRETRSANHSIAASSVSGVAPTVRDTVFHVNECLRPRSFDFADPTPVEHTDVQSAPTPVVQQPGFQMATVSSAPTSICVKGSGYRSTIP